MIIRKRGFSVNDYLRLFTSIICSTGRTNGWSFWQQAVSGRCSLLRSPSKLLPSAYITVGSLWRGMFLFNLFWNTADINVRSFSTTASDCQTCFSSTCHIYHTHDTAGLFQEEQETAQVPGSKRQLDNREIFYRGNRDWGWTILWTEEHKKDSKISLTP